MARIKKTPEQLAYEAFLEEDGREQEKRKRIKEVVFFFFGLSLVTLTIIIIVGWSGKLFSTSENEILAIKQPDGSFKLLDEDGDDLTDARYGSVLFDDVDYLFGPSFDTIRTYGAFVKRGGKWGYINEDGKEIIEPIYDSVANFFSGKAWVKLGNVWGLVNKNAETIITPQYLSYLNGVSNFPFVLSGSKWGVLNIKIGKEVVPPKYQDLGIRFNSSGITWAKFNDEFVFLDTLGNETKITSGDEEIKNVEQNDEGFIIKSKDNYGLADSRGSIIVPCAYNSIVASSEGYKVNRYGLYGFLDKNGKVILSAEYDSFESTPYGFWLIKDGYYGYADNNGNAIVPCEYDEISREEKGFHVQKDGNHGFINFSGKSILLCAYEAIELREEGIVYKYNDRLGFMTYQGVDAIPALYDEIKIEGANYARVKSAGNYGWYDMEKGEIAIPIKYDFVWDSFDSRYDIIRVRYEGEPIKIDYYGREIKGEGVVDKVKRWLN